MIKREASSLQIWRKPVLQAYPGDIVGIHVKTMSAQAFIKHFRGFLVGCKDKDKVKMSAFRHRDEFIDVNRFHPSPEDEPLFDDVPTFTKRVIADILFVKTQLGKPSQCA
jgi:hypothetical protein